MATEKPKSLNDEKRQGAPSRAPKSKSPELSEAELGKVSGGVRKSGDPCDGGNVH
jgi:hypothetical protein